MKEFIGTTADSKLFVAVSFECSLPFKVVFGIIRKIAPILRFSASEEHDGKYTLQLRYMTESKVLSVEMFTTILPLLRYTATVIIDIEHTNDVASKHANTIMADIIGTQNAEEESRTQSSKKFSNNGCVGKCKEETMVKGS